MRRMEGEVVETEGGPLKGSGGGISSFVGESGLEEVFEACENIESTEERMLEDTEEVELVERRLTWMRFGSAEKEAYSTYDSAFL